MFLCPYTKYIIFIVSKICYKTTTTIQICDLLILTCAENYVGGGTCEDTRGYTN